MNLNNYFTINEQKQFKMYNFNSILLNDLVNGNLHDIKFDNLDNNKLHNFFENICYGEIEVEVDGYYYYNIFQFI